jgi:hypothetical protein
MAAQHHAGARRRIMRALTATSSACSTPIEKIRIGTAGYAMTFLLLIGAGFSYNWGGPLASNIFSSLLADKDLDDRTRDLLFDSGRAGNERPRAVGKQKFLTRSIRRTLSSFNFLYLPLYRLLY